MKIMLMFFVAMCPCLSFGQVHIVETHSILTVGSRTQSADGDYLKLVDVTSMGTCALNGGLVELRIPSDLTGNRSFSILLSAKMAGQDVTVTVKTPNVTADGYCILHKVEFAN